MFERGEEGILSPRGEKVGQNSGTSSLAPSIRLKLRPTHPLQYKKRIALVNKSRRLGLNRSVADFWFREVATMTAQGFVGVGKWRMVDNSRRKGSGVKARAA